MSRSFGFAGLSYAIIQLGRFHTKSIFDIGYGRGGKILGETNLGDEGVKFSLNGSCTQYIRSHAPGKDPDSLN